MYDECAKNLAVAVIALAIDDYRALKSGCVASCYRNYNELNVFFKSSYCEMLMLNCGISPQQLLNILNSESFEERRLRRKLQRKSNTGSDI